ncbi:MAG: hypothetical protein ACRD3W_08695 [Terriglobales bacterium]
MPPYIVTVFSDLLVAVALATVSIDALAVQLNPRGLGQVLLFPYYTARSTPEGAYTTLFVVTNTTSDAKVLRVRFRESRNGREAAGTNLYLRPFDSWSGAVYVGENGLRAGSLDHSCTDPLFIPFTNAQYAGSNADGEDTSLDRSAEGYIEVIEMGVIADPTLLGAMEPKLSGGTLVYANCYTVRDIPLDNETEVMPPSGGLTGSAFLINVLEGTLYSEDAVALDDFSGVALWAPPDTATPSLQDVNPKVSKVLDVSGYRESQWSTDKGANPVDPVSAVLMQNQLLNQFVLDAATRSGTDWIVTMPTKPAYVSSPVQALPPFESTFGAGGAPDFFGIAPGCIEAESTMEYDREGNNDNQIIDLPLLPPYCPHLLSLPWVANVVTFGNSSILASTIGIPIAGLYQDGWLRLEPFQYATSKVHRLVSTDTPPAIYFGLPMIGFMANNYTNGALPSASGPVLSNYSATSPHKGTLRIE